MLSRFLSQVCVTFALLLLCVVTFGCGQSYTIEQSGDADIKNINHLMSELDAPEPGRQRKAMFWIRQLKPSEGEPALPKLQELATKSKFENVKAAAQETISHIQGG